ncbi:MAG: YdeI/OmpD-associated family protein [Pseudomonadota bacterium]
MSDAPRVEVASTDALWAWLAIHHTRDSAVWLVTWKKSDADRYVGRDDVLDALVAFGWIDGRRMKLDEARTMQLIAPRRQQAWAQSYKKRAARLIDEGRMQPAGKASIEAGKASGLWEFYADVDALRIPEDLAKALALRPPAAAQFSGFAPSAKRNILRWIKIAKTEATRTKRIAEVARLAADGRTPPHM